jgi:hypothetical protein
MTTRNSGRAFHGRSSRTGRCCANCEDFIPDRNGDAYGACSAVEGYIDSADWCSA